MKITLKKAVRDSASVAVTGDIGGAVSLDQIRQMEFIAAEIIEAFCTARPELYGKGLDALEKAASDYLKEVIADRIRQKKRDSYAAAKEYLEIEVD